MLGLRKRMEVFGDVYLAEGWFGGSWDWERRRGRKACSRVKGASRLEFSVSDQVEGERNVTAETGCVLGGGGRMIKEARCSVCGLLVVEW